MMTTLIAAALAGGASNVELTVYNQGFAFVKEIREFDLKQGIQQVKVEDVPSSIEATSVGIKGLGGFNFSVLEQNYQYDLISPIAILNKAVGQKIRVTRWFGNTKEVLEGTLLSSPTAMISDAGGGQSFTYNGLVLRTDDGRIVLSPTGEVEVQSLPNGLISKPTLSWLLDSATAGTNKIQMSYLTQGMSWTSDYVLMIGSKPSEPASMQGWVTLTNNSGGSFANAKLKLLAGDVNRAPQNAPSRGMVMEARAMMAKAADSNFKEESLFEYHLYTLQRPATVANHEIKQVALVDAEGIKTEKKIIVDSMMDFGGCMPSEGEIGTGDIKPIVKLIFKNSKENGLGIPLPKGRVKVYMSDASGSSQMLGEDNIDHTPKNEKITLNLGRSFDIRATRKRLDYKRISDRAFRETFEIEVRNNKEVAETVNVYERHWGDWNVNDSNLTFEKLDSQTMGYTLVLAGSEAKKIRYTVTTKW